MKRFIELSQIPTAELLEIKKILEVGAKAYASKAGDEVRKLRIEAKEAKAEAEALRKVQERREVVENAGLEWDGEYFMALSDMQFDITIRKLVELSKNAYAEVASNRLNIPPIFIKNELDDNPIHIIKQGFSEMKGGKGV